VLAVVIAAAAAAAAWLFNRLTTPMLWSSSS
jgi:uncharacterized protein (DUF2062 family)